MYRMSSYGDNLDCKSVKCDEARITTTVVATYSTTSGPDSDTVGVPGQLWFSAVDPASVANTGIWLCRGGPFGVSQSYLWVKIADAYGV